MTLSELVEAVREHAFEYCDRCMADFHLNTNAWDVLSESMTDAEVAAAIGDATTFEAAVVNVRLILDPIEAERVRTGYYGDLRPAEDDAEDLTEEEQARAIEATNRRMEAMYADLYGKKPKPSDE